MAEVKFTSTNKAILEQAEQVVEFEREILLRAERLASGDLLASLGYEYKVLDNGEIAVVFNSNSVDYASYIDEGTRPRSLSNGLKGIPPPRAIENWIRAKRIKPFGGKSIEQTSWAIAVAIKRDGIKPTPFVQPSLDYAQRIMGGEDVAEALAEDVESYFEVVATNLNK